MEERIEYIITVRPEVCIEYTIEADSETEAWKKFYENDYYSKEYIQKDFTNNDLKSATIKKCHVTIIRGRTSSTTTNTS